MAGLIAEEVKRRVRETTDIVDLVRSYGIELKRAGRNLKAVCPFHQEKTASFNVNPEGQYFKCFGCGKSGDVFSFVMLHERVEFPDALRMLAERAGIQVEYDPVAASQAKKEGDWKSYLYKLNTSAAAYFREMLYAPAGEAARAYLEKRGLKPEMWERFGLGYAPSGGLVARLQAQKAPPRALERAGLASLREDGSAFDYFRDRLMFPISDVQGRVIGFGGRVLGDGEPKYLNTRETPVFSKGRTIYGLHQAREAIVETRRAVLMEGYTDVIMSHQFGQRNVVAALGTAITADHVRMLRRVADQMVVLTDSDAAGARAAERSLEVLFQEGEDEGTRIVRLPGEAKDPCDFLLEHGAEPFVAALQQGQRLFDYKFERVVAGHDIGTPGGQAAAAKELMALVSLLPDVRQRTAYRAEVAARLRLDESALEFVRRKAPVEKEEFNVGPPPAENQVAGAERELLGCLFHQPAFIEAAVGDVDLTAFRGTGERLIGKAILAAVDAGRLPPDLNNLSPDTHSLSGMVAREVLTGLSEDADLFEGGKLVKEEDLARARSLCVALAEEETKLEKASVEEHYNSILLALRRANLEEELREVGRAVAAAEARGDVDALAEAVKRREQIQFSLGPAPSRLPGFGRHLVLKAAVQRSDPRR